MLLDEFPRGRPLLFLVLCVGAACARAPEPPAPRARNVLFITVDTLRADRLAMPGLMPELSALAARGVTFVDAVAHAPLTVPAHASLMTGLLPPQHGVRDNAGFALPASRVTLASALRNAGFRTGAFVGAYVLARHTGLDRGFERYDDEFDRRAARITLTSLERRAAEVTDRAARWIREGSQPFFAWVHLYDPHAPYAAPPAFANRFPDRPYDAEVAASDFAIGELLRALPSATRDDTLVVVTSDHGESLGEHGEREHGIFVYDATLSVPLVIAGPGAAPGRRVAAQVRHVDVAPTVMALVGQPWTQGGGLNLLALMNGATEDDPRLSYAESAFGQLHFGWSPLRSLRDGEWKYIEAPAPELYDLRQDGSERENLYANRKPLAAGMAQHLTRYAKPEGPTEETTDSFTAEALRSLGYVSGGGAPGSAAADPKSEIHRYNEYVDRFNAGLEALETGRAREAEDVFRTLAAAFPDSFEAHQYLGRARAARGKHRAAIRAFASALGLRGSDAGVLRDAALSEAALGRFDRAGQLLESAARVEPTSVSRYLVEGMVSAMAGQGAEARRAFEDALKIVPGQASALYELARLDEREGRPAEALDRYRAALASDPTLDAAREGVRRLGAR
jgi:choline-sulfatase